MQSAIYGVQYILAYHSLSQLIAVGVNTFHLFRYNRVDCNVYFSVRVYTNRGKKASKIPALRNLKNKKRQI